MKVKSGSKKSLIFVVIIGVILGIMLGTILVEIRNNLIHKDYMELEKVKNEVNKIEVPVNTIKEPVTEPLEKNNELVLLPTVLDDLESNSAYCATFQIVWNELMDFSVDGQAIELLGGNIPSVDNLNERKFEKNELSDSSYYVKVDKTVLSVKKEIEDAIKDKFNETSDILDNVEWIDDSNIDKEEVTSRIFYTMLKKIFTFEEPFDILNEDFFGEEENVKYFGIDEDSNYKLKEQVDVCYYADYENFAVKLNTMQNDEVILLRTNEEFKNFEEAYKYLNKKQRNIMEMKNLRLKIL